MPLVRYEIRNEHSLANPQLYRSAAKDDPEGLLEGVAMAGLVGIVRQLGDLAEFAAEVFRDLHEEVMATASRGHDLLARVQQLEAEMPAVEKALLSETNQLRFAYTPGAEWHASTRYDQNHCTQGDLPRFIRHSYEECRGPPRLFLLDKFDVAGAGACLKRYTDPSFFRTEWASSELMKAERVQRDKKARREKKKGRRRRNGDGKETIIVDQLFTRFSKELTEPDQPRTWHLPLPERSSAPEPLPEPMTFSQRVDLFARQDVQSSPTDADGYNQYNLANSLADLPPPEVSEAPVSPKPEPMEQLEDPSTIDIEKEGIPENFEDDARVEFDDGLGSQFQQEDGIDVAEDGGSVGSQLHQEDGTDTADDGGSEGEQFLDALATMDSEVESEWESRLRQDRDPDADQMSDVNENQSPPRQDSNSIERSQTSVDESVILPNQSQRRPLWSIPSQQDPADHARVALLGVHRFSNSPLHMRRHSIDSSSISSSDSRRAKHDFERYDTFIPRKEQNEVRKLNEYESRSSSNTGVLVSKMVAVFDRGFLEQRHDGDGDKESRDVSETVRPLESLANSTDQTLVKPNRLGVSVEENLDQSSLQHINIPFLASPLIKASNVGSPPLLLRPPTFLRIEVEDSSYFSRHVSLGSLDSSPNSNTLSALQSPPSPIQPSWTILSSPDSQRLGSSNELNGPGSPSSVPVLASSPSSKMRSPFLSEDFGGKQSPLNLSSPKDEPLTRTSSSSSVELPSSPPHREPSTVAASSSNALTTFSDSDAAHPSPAEDSEDHASLSQSISSDDLPNSPPTRLASDLDPAVLNSSGNLQELDIPLVTGKQTPTDESEQSSSPSPRSQNVDIEGSMPPAETLDDLGTSPMPIVVTATASPSTDGPRTMLDKSLSPRRPGLSAALPDVIPRQVSIKQEQTPSFKPLRLEENAQGSNLAAVSSISSQSPFVASSKLPQDLRLSPLPPLQSLSGLSPPPPPSKSLRDPSTPGPPKSLTLHELPPPPPPLRSPPTLSVVKPAPTVDVQDKLLDAITTHDRSTLKKVRTMQNPMLRSGNERSHLLEQIRAQSFNLRHTVVEKMDPPPGRPVTNISVAAILEKANAIRQAFAGSDEDEDEDEDDWSDV